MSELNTGDYLEYVSDLKPAIEGLRLGEYSDLVDQHGHQYIDIVMECQGTQGLALLGYLHVLEACGLRFIGIGATSTGAITAIALAAVGRPSERRVEPLIGALSHLPVGDFVDGRHDGDSDAMSAIQAWLDDDAGTISKVWKTSRILDNFSDIGAINRGEAFHRWMDRLLRNMNSGLALSVQRLRARMNDLPGLLVRDSADESDFRQRRHAPAWEVINGTRVHLTAGQPDRLCVVAADIATETRVKLPEMAPLLWPHPEQVNVADFARAAISIPGLFATFKVKSLPADEARPLWRGQNWPESSLAGEFLPEVHHLVDGGVLSSFPIDAFHDKAQVPLRPTFGVKLRSGGHKHRIHGMQKVMSQSFKTARSIMDEECLRRDPDHSRLVAHIDADDIGWLDFAMDKDTQLRLFRMGAMAATSFLRTFNWREYKRIRRALAEAHKPHG